MVEGKQVKDCWGKNEGVGKMKKMENGFTHSYFSILINDNHHLQCVSYLYKLCRLGKNSLK